MKIYYQKKTYIEIKNIWNSWNIEIRIEMKKKTLNNLITNVSNYISQIIKNKKNLLIKILKFNLLYYK